MERRTMNITTFASQKRASQSLHRKRKNQIVAMIHGHPRKKRKKKKTFTL